MSVAIFDLDNCLSDDAWRIPLIDWKEEDLVKRYTPYHEACEKDKPANVNYLNTARTNGHKIVFITGRPESVRDKTERWISANLIEFGFYDLLMRPTGDCSATETVKESLLIQWCSRNCVSFKDIVVAYDDHKKILEMYVRNHIPALMLKIHNYDAYAELGEFQAPQLSSPGEGTETFPLMKDAALVLEQMAKTFRERNGVYRDNFKMIPKMVSALWPNGVPPELVLTEQWHLFELLLVKAARFASSNLTHQDSMHDAAVYAAMIESILINQGEKK